jgi:hypothetical protein
MRFALEADRIRVLARTVSFLRSIWIIVQAHATIMTGVRRETFVRKRVDCHQEDPMLNRPAFLASTFVAVSSLLPILSALAGAQTVTALCNPEIVENRTVATPAQREAAGNIAQPRLTDHANGRIADAAQRIAATSRERVESL